MSISNNSGASASTRSGSVHRRHNRKCAHCKRFGTFAPNSIVCDRCLGTLPLIFSVTITVTIGGAR